MSNHAEGKKPFDPKDHFIKIKSGWGDNLKESDYLPVQQRLVWFREKYPHGTIETSIIHLDLESEYEEEKTEWENRKPKKVIKRAKGVAIFHAIASDGEGGVAHGTKMEKRVSFDDFLEKAESGAIGRALAGLGYGTQFTADELNESYRVVDSPTEEEQQPTKITLTKEQRAAYAEETVMLAAHMESTDFLAFCQLVGANPESKWGDQEYSAAHQKLAQYGAPKSMQDKFSSYTAILTTPAIQRFAKRILKKSLANSCALDVARSIELLDKAAFLEALAKQYDPEHTKIKAIGADYADGKSSVDHVLDCFGHPKEDDLLKEYKGFLRGEYLACPEKLKDFPVELQGRHCESWKRLTAPKKEQQAS